MAGTSDFPQALDAETRTTPRVIDAVTIPRLELHVDREHGAAVSRAVVLDGDLVRLGSHLANDLVIRDPLVSRFHCTLSRAGGAWRLIDTGALNGTRLDGVRVRDADLSLPECRIDLGDSTVRVRELRGEGEEELPVWPSFGALYGGTVAMRRLFKLLDRVARGESTVLIEGESGTGKELVAAEIIERGPRRRRPFVIVDCGAISPSLIESELFGHVRGAFTGASRDRAGAFEEADGGTVLLDEVGELPLDMQPKLLRALEAHEVRRIGETRYRKVEVRVLAATNRCLEREVNRGRFREDLYYRLSVVSVRIPPLRERLEDLPMLVDVLLARMHAPGKAELFPADVLADMAHHGWPGNVRELRNYVERVVLLDAPLPAPRAERPAEGAPAHAPPIDLELPFTAAKERVMVDWERRYLGALLGWARGNVSQAARKVGMDRMHLHRLLQRYGLRGAALEAPVDQALASGDGAGDTRR